MLAIDVGDLVVRQPPLVNQCLPEDRSFVGLSGPAAGTDHVHEEAGYTMRHPSDGNANFARVGNLSMSGRARPRAHSLPLPFARDSPKEKPARRCLCASPGDRFQSTRSLPYMQNTNSEQVLAASAARNWIWL